MPKQIQRKDIPPWAWNVAQVVLVLAGSAALLFLLLLLPRHW
jgi:hypothetical protein